MQGVITQRLAGWGIAAVISAMALGGTVAVFAAGGPGEHLRPIDGAELLIEVTQTQESILWVSLSGPVSTVRALSWPVDDGVHELGGALTIERPFSGETGTIDTETPMSVEFTLED